VNIHSLFWEQVIPHSAKWTGFSDFHNQVYHGHQAVFQKWVALLLSFTIPTFKSTNFFSYILIEHGSVPLGNLKPFSNFHEALLKSQFPLPTE
jgi:hypothetical protein